MGMLRPLEFFFHRYRHSMKLTGGELVHLGSEDPGKDSVQVPLPHLLLKTAYGLRLYLGEDGCLTVNAEPGQKVGQTGTCGLWRYHLHTDEKGVYLQRELYRPPKSEDASARASQAEGIPTDRLKGVESCKHEKKPNEICDCLLEHTFDYPDLVPSYFTWKREFEDLVKEGATLSESGPFPNIPRRVLWDIGGFLIACWLALQYDVESVEYSASKTLQALPYKVGKENVTEALEKFLCEVEKALEKEKCIVIPFNSEQERREKAQFHPKVEEQHVLVQDGRFLVVTGIKSN